MAQSDIEKKANKISSSQLQNGKEFEQMQAAQNQLLQIQAAQNQNLAEQRMIGNSLDAQNQILAQAAEIGAMSVNQPTQGVLNKYGLSRPITTSTTKQSSVVTKQNITINNNTTNITNTAADIGGPIQGRGIQFKDPVASSGLSNFRDWISKTFQKQGEETRKRNLEYSKRESSLTKSSNKIMRKLEDFSKSITSRLDPRRITNTFGEGFTRLLKLFGFAYMAKNTGKILDGIKFVIDSGKDLFSWFRGGKTPKFIKEISGSIGQIIFGKENFEKKDFQEHGILWGFYNERGTGVLNKLWNDISDKFSHNAELAKQYAGSSEWAKVYELANDKKNWIAALMKALSLITNYTGILLGGERGVAKALNAEIREAGNNLGESNEEIEKTADATYKKVSYGNAKDVAAAGASAYVTNGNAYNGSYNINNGVRDSKYGNKAAVRLLNSTMTDYQGQLRQSNMATMGVFADLQAALVDKNKAGAAETAIDDLRLISQYAKKHDEPMLADLNTIRGLTGDSSLKGAIYLPVARQWTYAEKYPNEVSANKIVDRTWNAKKVQVGTAVIGGGIVAAGGAVMGGIAAHTAGTAVAIGALKGFATAGLAIPGFGWVAAALVGTGLLVHLLASPKLQGGMQVYDEAINYKLHAAAEADLIIDFVKADLVSMKEYWVTYGDYYVLTSVIGMNDPSIRHNPIVLRKNGEYIAVTPTGNVDSLIEKVETDPETGTTLIWIRDDWMSLFDDNYLKRILKLAREKKVQSIEMAEVTDKLVEQMIQNSGFIQKNANGDTLFYEDTDAVREFAAKHFSPEGAAGVLERAKKIDMAKEAGVEFSDDLAKKTGNFYRNQRGNEQMARKVQRGVREGSVGAQFHTSSGTTTTSTSGASTYTVTYTGGGNNTEQTNIPSDPTASAPTPATNSGEAVWSRLVNKVLLLNGKNGGKRKQKISKLTIHHMTAVWNVEDCYNEFKNGKDKNGDPRQASSNYGIGVTGEIAVYVPENYIPWTSSSSKNDSIAVTIEVSNSATGDDSGWPISGASYNSLVNLCADVCVRNDIPRVNYTGNKNGVITSHWMFANTICPGPFIRHLLENGKLVDDINRKISELKSLGGSTPETKEITLQVGGSGEIGSGASGDDGPLTELKMAIQEAWNSSLVFTKNLAGGFLEKIQGTDNYINGVKGSIVFPNSGYKTTLSDSTKDVIRRYTGVGVNTGGSYAMSTPSTGSAKYKALEALSNESESTRRVLKTLFNDKGELIINNTEELNPILKEALLNIQEELKKGTEMDKAQIKLNARIAEDQIKLSGASTQATVSAIRGLSLGNNTPAVQSKNGEI